MCCFVAADYSHRVDGGFPTLHVVSYSLVSPITADIFLRDHSILLLFTFVRRTNIVDDERACACSSVPPFFEESRPDDEMAAADRVPSSFFSDYYLAVCNFFSSKVNDTITTLFFWSLVGHS